jgi:hypothetical protein
VGDTVQVGIVLPQNPAPREAEVERFAGVAIEVLAEELSAGHSESYLNLSAC